MFNLTRDMGRRERLTRRSLPFAQQARILLHGKRKSNSTRYRVSSFVPSSSTEFFCGFERMLLIVYGVPSDETIFFHHLSFKLTVSSAEYILSQSSFDMGCGSIFNPA